MTLRRLILLTLAVAAVAGPVTALAQETDYDRVRAASENGPPPKAEGVVAAEALNADVNRRNAEAAARDREADDAYARGQREYEAKKRADAAAYAKAVAEYEARKAEVERQRQADLAAWKAQVAACKAGDKTACAPS